MAQFKAYAPRVVQYIAGEDLNAAECVSISGFTTVERASPSLDTTFPCPQVSKVPAGETEDFLGIVLNDASSGEWVDVVVEGITEAKFTTGHTIIAGAPCRIDGSTAGQLAEIDSSTLLDWATHGPEEICCIAAEADTSATTGAAEKIKVYIPPRRVSVGGGLI